MNNAEIRELSRRLVVAMVNEIGRLIGQDEVDFTPVELNELQDTTATILRAALAQRVAGGDAPENATPSPELVPCPECEGAGSYTETYYVTRDMAIDAGEPAMEGMPMPEVVTCQSCGGDGYVPAPSTKKTNRQIAEEIVASKPLAWCGLVEDIEAALDAKDKE